VKGSTRRALRARRCLALVLPIERHGLTEYSQCTALCGQSAFPPPQSPANSCLWCPERPQCAASVLPGPALSCPANARGWGRPTTPAGRPSSGILTSCVGFAKSSPRRPTSPLRSAPPSSSSGIRHRPPWLRPALRDQLLKDQARSRLVAGSRFRRRPAEHGALVPRASRLGRGRLNRRIPQMDRGELRPATREFSLMCWPAPAAELPHQRHPGQEVLRNDTVSFILLR
jgi:hypothetical protein